MAPQSLLAQTQDFPSTDAYATFSGVQVAHDSARKARVRRVAGVGLLCLAVVAAGFIGGHVGSSDTAAASSSDIIVDPHTCPPWTEFCINRPSCLDKYHNPRSPPTGRGSPTEPVNPLRWTDYKDDCDKYCIECECPGEAYCEMLGESVMAQPTGTNMNGDVGSWTSTTNHSATVAQTGPCDFVGASIYSQTNQMYPACPDTYVLFGLDEGGLCCNVGADGVGCVEGFEGEGADGADDVLCSVYGNVHNVHTPCEYTDKSNICGLAYGLSTWTNVDFSMYFSYDGEHAGPFVNMENPEDPRSPRYWLRFGENFGLYKYDPTGAEAISPVYAGPDPIAHWSFDQDLTDHIGSLDFEDVTGQSYIDTTEGALVLDGNTVLHTNGAATEAGPVALEKKTLALWVSVETLDQQYGTSPMSVETMSPHAFDALVFEERQSNKWMAGSDYFERTQDLNGAELIEYNAGVKQHLAVVYGGRDEGKCVFPFTYYGVTYNDCSTIGSGGVGTWPYPWCATAVDAAGEYTGAWDKCGCNIEIFKNGVSQGSYEAAGRHDFAANEWGITIGMRHRSGYSATTGGQFNCGGGLGCFEGKIYDMTIYDDALSEANIAAIYGGATHEAKFPPGNTYHVRMTTTYEETGWDYAHTGGFCNDVSGEWQDSTGATRVLTQSSCDLTEGSDTGTISGTTLTMYGLTGILYHSADVGWTVEWSDSTQWTLRMGRAQRIQAWVDDEQVVDVSDNTLTSGAVGVATYHAKMAAFGVKIHDAEVPGVTKYGQMMGSLASNGIMSVYIDGMAYAEDIPSDQVQNVRMTDDYDSIAVSMTQPAVEHANGQGSTMPTWTWTGPATFTGSTQESFPSDNGNRFDRFGYTVMIWTKPSSYPGDWQRLIGKGDSTNRNYGLWLRNDGVPLAQVYGVSAANSWTGGSAVPTGTWTHMALRTDASDCSHALFINGYMLTSTSNCADISPNNDGDALTLGYAGFHTYFIGELKDAAIFGSALTDNEIAAWGGGDNFVLGENDDFLYVASSMTYYNAKAYCEDLGRELATVYSASQEDQIRSLVGNNHVWIGFQDIENEGTFVWDDDERGQSSYSNWWSGEPNNAGGEDCTAIWYHVDGWNDYPCTWNGQFVCGPEYNFMYELGFTGSITSSSPDTLDGAATASNGIYSSSQVAYSEVSATLDCGAGSAATDWDYASAAGLNDQGCESWCTLSGPDCVGYGMGVADGSTKVSENHPTSSTAGGDCVNGMADVAACQAHCQTDPTCTGFWYYGATGSPAGRCCPKATFNRDFSRVIAHSADGGFYEIGARECRVYMKDNIEPSGTGTFFTFTDSGTAADEAVVEGDGANFYCKSKDSLAQTGTWTCSTLANIPDVTAVADDSWVDCTVEHSGVPCTCMGVVRYGMDSTWSNPMLSSGELECSNGVFGDPLPGVVKKCQCINWYDSAYPAADWEPAVHLPVVESNFAADLDFVGLYTTASDDNAIVQGTGSLYCKYRKPAPPAADVDELIVGGGFEVPTATAWQTASSSSASSVMPPGWTVTSGDVDWGKYIAGGHCTDDCAEEGSQQIDMCGGTQGAIEQTVATTAGATYRLSFAYNAHASCGGSEKTLRVIIDNNADTTYTITKTRCGGWSSYATCWQTTAYDITAASDSTTIKLQAVDSSCGCMTVDDVSFRAVV